MGAEKVVPTERELGQFDLNSPDIVELIHHAEQGDAADRLLTIRQALAKYKKAVFWAMFLSTSLIMEGYDLSMVRIDSSPSISVWQHSSDFSLSLYFRSRPSMDRVSSKPVSERLTPSLARNASLRHGNLGCPTQLLSDS